MRVLLRCDASAGSGVGHLVRCLALAEAAHSRGWEATLLGSVDAPLGRRLVAAAGVPVQRVGGLSARNVARLHADVVHVDHYGITADLRGNGPLVSSMEDGAFGRRPGDVVVDSTLGAERDHRPDDGSGEVLLGVAYAPLRASVRAARQAAVATSRAAVPDDMKPDVLVVMGGTDAFGVSAAAAHIAELAGASRIRVVAAGDAGDRVRAAVPSAEVIGAQEDLPGLAAASGVVLTAAGTSVWELACVGVPMALVAVTENQRAGYERAVEAGVGVGLGPLSGLRSGAPEPVSALANLLADPALRGALRRTARSLVDGLGSERVLDAWWTATGNPPLRARRARADDGDLLLAWRNDPGTRASSRSQEPVARDAHLRWLDDALADPGRRLFVVEHCGVPVATVRFDEEGSRLWEVSITVAPDARGRGLAAAVLDCAERAWRADVGSGPSVLACVRPGNTASARLFQAAGYRRQELPGTDGLDAYIKPDS